MHCKLKAKYCRASEIDNLVASKCFYFRAFLCIFRLWSVCLRYIDAAHCSQAKQTN